MKSNFTVKKSDVIRAARNARRRVLRMRMRYLRQATISSFGLFKICFTVRRVLGMPPPQGPSVKEVRARMRQIWERPAGMGTFPDYRYAGWGTYGQANGLLAACAVACGETVHLSREDAAFVHEYLPSGKKDKAS